MRKATGIRKYSVLLLALALFAAPRQAQAQCETPAPATIATQALAVADVLHINQYLQQELNFTQLDLSTTATNEVATRFDQFNDNILAWFNNWWQNSYLPAMKDMTKQLSAAELDQSRAQGSMTDATLQNEIVGGLQKKEVEARRRLTPSETACQIDQFGMGQTKGYKLARAVARGLAYDFQGDLGNRASSPAGPGKATQMRKMWTDYKTYFCDPDSGDQGCTAAGSEAGRNNDLAAILWGDKQTQDMSTGNNVLAMETLTRNVAGPFAPNPIPATALPASQGREELLMRRAKRARINTINNTIGQMVGERVGGTGVNTQALRIASGTSPADASTDASYREIQQAATRERFTDPDYLFKMVNYPETVVREQGAINAIRLQQLSDLYKRLEEMVFVEAAVLGSMVDQRVPGNAHQAAPKR